MYVDPLKVSILQAREREEDDSKIVKHFAYLEVNDIVVHKKGFKEIIDNKEKRLKPSIEDSPVLELKELPSHLEYDSWEREQHYL